MSDKNGPHTIGQKPAAYAERQAVRADYKDDAPVIPQHEMDVYLRTQIGRAKLLPDGRWELWLTAGGGDPLVYSDEEFRSIYARSNPGLLAYHQAGKGTTMKRHAMNLIEEWADNGWTVNLEYRQGRADNPSYAGGWACEVYETVRCLMPGMYVEGCGVTAEEAVEKAADEIAKAKARSDPHPANEER